MLYRLLLGTSRQGLVRALAEHLEGDDIVVTAFVERTLFWERVGKESCDLVLVSRPFLRPVDDALDLLLALPDRPSVVVLDRTEDARERARLLAAGCDGVLPEHLAPAVLAEAVESLLRRRYAADGPGDKPLGLTDEARLSDFVSHSASMRAFLEVVKRVTPGDTTLLLLGETGVGKERLARAIHAESPRARAPFVAVNCGALPEGLLESELFGHVDGAFTGATRPRRGCFELAHRGVLFLDELAEMPLHLQVRLLRVLQDRKVQRVGGERPVPVDVRVMAATNRNLWDEVEAGRFRRDLYYRLGVVSLTLPPLRERVEDIPDLVESYLAHLRPRIGSTVERIRPDALEALVAYGWPGNVRELINVIERGMLLARGDVLTPRDLPETIVRSDPASRGGGERGVERGGASGAGRPAPAPRLPSDMADRPWREVRDEALAEIERAYLAEQLRRCRGRIGLTARRAGIQPRSLYAKMRRLGLRKEDFKTGASRDAPDGSA